MSGPKVLSIRAQRSLRRECAQRLRELHAEIRRCLDCAKGQSAVADDLRRNSENLLASLSELREAGQWVELLAQTTSYRDFYAQEAGSLAQKAVENRAAVLRRLDRVEEGVEAIMIALSALPTSGERDGVLKDLEEARSPEAKLQALTAAVEWVADSRRKEARSEEVAQLRILSAGYADPNWGSENKVLPGAEKPVDAGRLERIWILLAELELEHPQADFAGWKERARFGEAASASQRGLRLDSLCLELGEFLRKNRLEKALRVALGLALEDLAEKSSMEADIWRRKLQEALAEAVLASGADELLSAVRAWMVEENRREDAEAQRVAVLGALVELGYEVREGMATAWTEEGRVVVHKPGESVYGVEVSAPSVGNALQVRVVAKGEASRSQQRDKEVEETWCGEFSRLRALLAEEGFPTELKQAHAPGEVAIKTIAGGESKAEQERNRQGKTAPQMRQI
ncbi:MAG: hypothetical protein WCI46_02475 [Verrucomicrobiota bacterium]